MATSTSTAAGQQQQPILNYPSFDKLMEASKMDANLLTAIANSIIINPNPKSMDFFWGLIDKARIEQQNGNLESAFILYQRTAQIGQAENRDIHVTMARMASLTEQLKKMYQAKTKQAVGSNQSVDKGVGNLPKSAEKSNPAQSALKTGKLVAQEQQNKVPMLHAILIAVLTLLVGFVAGKLL